MSQYIVSARKYRPQSFDEVIGQDHISNTLKNALDSDQLAHAFLFCGPRGVGKTTCARILAKVINCENPVNKHQACEECSSCLGFHNNASFNIFELDAASHNSVEHIRTLNEQVRFQPQQGTHKVFIIDEVHMLSQSAFNAFLKTLEEPPAHAIFILATTEKHKIIPTILSRCQVFDFYRIQPSDIVRQLTQVAKNENLNVEVEGLHAIASKSDGAMRDALSIFDRIASATGSNIRYQDVVKNLNILDYEVFFKTVTALQMEDMPKIFLILDDVLKRGFEADQFVLGLAEHFRNLLLVKDELTIPIMELSEALSSKYKEQAKLANTEFLINSLSILNECDIEYPKAKNKRLHVEVGLMRINYLNRAFSPLEVNTATPEKKTLHESESPTKQKIESIVVEKSAENKEDVNPEKVEAILEKPNGNGNHQNKRIKPDTPSLNSLSNLYNQAKASLDQEKPECQDFSLDNVQEIWNDYASSLDSPSTKNMLSNTLLELGENKLIVRVGSNVAKEMIIQESGLFHEIRDCFQKPDMDLEVIISPELFPEIDSEIPKKYLTNKEKYDLLIDENPLVKKLVQTFELKLDND